FSSRRRHTRFSRDWSSDVCSSDLLTVSILTPRFLSTLQHLIHRPRKPTKSPCCPSVGIPVCFPSTAYTAKPFYRLAKPIPFGARSEERRVGKECRGRLSS